MQKISSIVLTILAVISVILAVLFFVGGYVTDAAGLATDEPRFTAMNLNWAYFLFIAAVALTLIFSIAHLISHPKALKGALVALVAGVVLVGVAYILASDAPLTTGATEGTSATTLKWVGTGIYLMYILGGLAIFGIIVSEIYRALR